MTEEQKKKIQEMLYSSDGEIVRLGTKILFELLPSYKYYLSANTSIKGIPLIPSEIRKQIKWKLKHYFKKTKKKGKTCSTKMS